MALLLLGALFVSAFGLAVWIVEVTGVHLGRGEKKALVAAIFFAPLMVGVVLDEFLIRPIRKGRPVPGRRKRTALSTPAEQGTRPLTRSPKDDPER